MFGIVLQDGSRCLGLSYKTNLGVWDCLTRRILVFGIVLQDGSRCLGLSYKTDLGVWDCLTRRI